MKVFTKKIATIAMALIISLFSVIPAFAVENLEVNGVKDIKKDDIVTYDLNLADCTEEIIGLQMYIFYDREYLQLEQNSFDTPQLNGVVSNTQGDYVTFNWTDISNPANFSKKKVMATVDFKVLKGGKTDITYFVSEMYGEDMTYLKNYTFTYDLTVNDKVVIDDETPAITKDKEAQDRFQGMFVNFVDGKGEENGNKKDNKKRETVLGETQPPSTFETGKEIEGVKSDFSKGIVPILIACAVILLIGAIVVLSIINNARHRKDDSENNSDDAPKTDDNSECEENVSTAKTTLINEDE